MYFTIQLQVTVLKDLKVLGDHFALFKNSLTRGVGSFVVHIPSKSLRTFDALQSSL